MTIKPWKPSVEEILELYEFCKKVYQPLFDQMVEDEKYYELKFKELLDIPKEFKNTGVVLPTARDMLDACVDHTDITNARVFVNRKGTSELSQDSANLMRKFCLGLIHRTTTENSISPWRVAAKHFWLHGLGVFKTVYDADRWPDKPIQKEGQSESDYAGVLDDWREKTHESLPIVIQAVNPQNVMPDPYEGGGRFVFEHREELCFNVKSRLGKRWGNPMSKGTNEKVLHISFWTKFFRCELYDMEPVLPGKIVEHKYGFLPYTFVDTGLGNLSSDNDPTKRYVGILRYIKDMLISESRDYSIADIVLSKTAWPWGTIEGDSAMQVTKLDQSFGTFTRLPRNTKIVPQTPQIPPEALSRHLALTASYVAGHAAPNSVRGMGEEGVRSGVDRRQMIAEAATKYVYSTEAFKNGTAKVLGNCALLFKNAIPGDLRIWARTPTDEFDEIIDPKDLQEPFNVYVEFAPMNEEDEYRRHDDLERLVASGIVTIPWSRTQMSNVDPEAMELQEEIELLKKSPTVAQISDQYLAAKMMEAMTKRSRADSVESPPPEMDMSMAQGVGLSGSQGAPGGNLQQPPNQGPPRAMSPQRNMQTPPNALQRQMEGMRRPVSIKPNQGRGGGGNG